MFDARGDCCGEEDVSSSAGPHMEGVVGQE